ncbi:protein RD3-like [Tubulanus polymorphus]|uniref:protein RD3-like n=1 Tax=Tubulanus polymorphus TaxID=672921 RepID=UPI003DA3538D
MAVSKWVKSVWNTSSSETGYRTGNKPEPLMVAESLLTELDFQIRDLEKLSAEREQETRRRQTGVDYSWLMTRCPAKSYQVPQLERLGLEELCYKVKPCECGPIIEEFRRCLESPRNPTEMPHLLRTVIHKQLDQRPKPETLLGNWVKRTTSLTNLRSRKRTKISPVYDDDDEIDELEMQTSESDSSSSFNKSLPIFTVQHEIQSDV